MREGGGGLPRHERLHTRIYLAVLASVVAVALLAGAAWHLSGRREARSGLETAAEITAEVLPPSEAPHDVQQAALERWYRRTGASLSLFTADRELVASAGQTLPPPPAGWTSNGLYHPVRGVPAVALRLPDGRWLVARRPHRPGAAAVGFLWLLALVAVAVGLAAWPVSRRITRRLSRLEASVDALGAGDLAVRVPVEGRDEVARLAASFNRAAGRIEALVGAQKRLLANASHELRSPLARMKVATVLLEGDPALKEEIARDVAELDGLVEEILLASRLEAGAAGDDVAEVDLAALAAEECARAGASFSGDLATVAGSPRLLRRMIRNLVENGCRHGGGSEVEVSLSRLPAGAVALDVCDRGAGVPPEARERVFEPFYRLPSGGGGAAGAGLGLALARQVARRHGGDVVFLPREGGGSRFRATLPGPAAAPTSAPGGASRPPA